MELDYPILRANSSVLWENRHFTRALSRPISPTVQKMEKPMSTYSEFRCDEEIVEMVENANLPLNALRVFTVCIT